VKKRSIPAWDTHDCCALPNPKPSVYSAGGGRLNIIPNTRHDAEGGSSSTAGLKTARGTPNEAFVALGTRICSNQQQKYDPPCPIFHPPPTPPSLWRSSPALDRCLRPRTGPGRRCGRGRMKARRGRDRRGTSAIPRSRTGAFARASSSPPRIS